MSEEEVLSLNNYLEDLYQAIQIGDIVFESKRSSELYNLINKLLKENQKYKETIKKLKNIIKNDDLYESSDFESRKFQKDLLDILKEVE